MKTDFSLLVPSLLWLAARGYISGSYAYAGATELSDIDVRLAERHVKVLKRLLCAQNVTWDSPFLGSITWWPEGVQVEVSYLFPRYRKVNTGLDVTIRGVRFKR